MKRVGGRSLTPRPPTLPCPAQLCWGRLRLCLAACVPVILKLVSLVPIIGSLASSSCGSSQLSSLIDITHTHTLSPKHIRTQRGDRERDTHWCMLTRYLPTVSFDVRCLHGRPQWCSLARTGVGPCLGSRRLMFFFSCLQDEHHGEGLHDRHQVLPVPLQPHLLREYFMFVNHANVRPTTGKKVNPLCFLGIANKNENKST